jgi:hypothetical protein
VTDIREHRRFGKRYLLINALTVLPFLPFFAFAFWRASAVGWDGWTWSGFGVFLLGAIFGLWYQHRRGTRFVCPERGQLIIGPVDDPGPGDSIDFLCEHCDISWKTGLQVPEDSGGG